MPKTQTNIFVFLVLKSGTLHVIKLLKSLRHDKIIKLFSFYNFFLNLKKIYFTLKKLHITKTKAQLGNNMILFIIHQHT